VSASNVHTIFISYRRDDSAPYAGRISDRLIAHFGAGQVFMDIDHIAPGEDFIEVIERTVGACKTTIVLIGRNWLDSRDAEGRRRLDDPEDFVRLEVAASLVQTVRVVPVLVGGATMPGARDLPEAIAPLARRHAIEVSDARFHSDCDRLIEALSKKPPARAAQTDEPKSGTTQVAEPQVSETATGPVQARTPVDRPTSASARGWTIAAVASLGVVTWAFFGLRNTDTASPVAPVTQAPLAQEPPPPSASGNTTQSTALEAKAPVQLKTILGGSSSLGSTKSVDQFLSESREKEIAALTGRATAGNAEAQFELGTIYELDTPVNLRLADYWYGLAAAQRYPLAQQGSDDVKALLRSGSAEPDGPVTIGSLQRRNARGELMRKRLQKITDEMGSNATGAISHIKPPN
jgi:TIR domain